MHLASSWSDVTGDNTQFYYALLHENINFINDLILVVLLYQYSNIIRVHNGALVHLSI